MNGTEDLEMIIIPDNIREFKTLCENMCKTYEAKNHDYGNSFDESCDKFGAIAGVVRISDKFNRICSLMKSKAKVNDEAIEDTLLDLGNYAIMLNMWITKNKKNK